MLKTILDRIKRKKEERNLLTSGWVSAAFLVAATAFLAFLNYQPNTWLTGWDNLHPEFDFALNLRRSLSAVWQEYQGLGLLGGMSHAADLPRQILLYLASFAVKPELLRYGATFAALLLGSLGMFFLIRIAIVSHFKPLHREFASLAGGLYYLLNLGTVQIFFPPYESFIVHYAALPWLVLVTLSWLTGKLKKTWPLVLTLILAAPLAYVGTVFVVTMVVLGVFLIEYLVTLKAKVATRKVGKYLLLVFLTNAYWLLPLLYFTVTQGAIVRTSRVNEYSTEDMMMRNLEFANLKDIMLLKGFWFEYVDRSDTGKFEYMFGVWRDHLANPVIAAVGYGSFILVILGILIAFTYKLPWRRSFLALFLLAVAMLYMTNQPLGFLFRWLEVVVPFFSEMFRSVFTKWSPVAMLAYAVLFGLGSLVILQFFRGLLGFISNKVAVVASTIALVGGLVAFMSPAFQGHLVAPSMRRAIPDEYFQLMRWLKDQDPATRIANFPQHAFWGWNFFDWGYRGSGFLWYGVEQPILDRAFDVWSNENEAYYREVSHAVYSKDLKAFEALLDKYQINWILVDHSVTITGEEKLLFLPELDQLLAESRKVTLAREFGKLSLYKTSLSYAPENYIYAPGKIKRVEPTERGRNDVDLVYLNEGVTYSRKGGQTQGQESEPSAIYPFRDFDLKNTTSPEDNGGEVVFEGQGWNIGGEKEELTLAFPDITKTDAVVPARVYAQAVDGQLLVRFNYLFPSLYVDGKRLLPEEHNSKIGMPLLSLDGPYILAINGGQFLTIPEFLGTEQFVGTTVLWTRQDNTFRLYAQSTSTNRDITDALLSQPVGRCSEEQEEEAFEKQVSEGVITLKGKRVVACIYTKVENFLASPQALLKTEFQFRAKDSRPIYLVIDGSSGEPVNATYTQNATYARDWKAFQEYTELNLANQSELWFQLLLDANEFDTERTIDYQRIVLTQFPPIASAIIQPSVVQVEMGKPNLVSVPARADTVQLVAPRVDSWATVVETATDERYFPSPRNCDNFNTTWFTRELRDDGGQSFLEYAAKDASSCDYWEFRNVPQEISYFLSLEHRNSAGKSIQMCLNNAVTKHCDFEMKLEGSKKWTKTNIPVWSMGSGKGYTLHVDTQAIGMVESRNSLRRIELVPAPLGWIASLKITPSSAKDTANLLEVKTVSKKDTALYVAEVTLSEKPGLVVLNQAYHQGWKAYPVDGSFSTKPTILQYVLLLPRLITPTEDHVLVNNWANGWLIATDAKKNSGADKTLAIVFVPQYLQWLGFLLPVGYLAASRFQKRPSRPLVNRVFSGALEKGRTVIERVRSAREKGKDWRKPDWFPSFYNQSTLADELKVFLAEIRKAWRKI